MVSFPTMIGLLVASAELSWLRQASAFQIPHAGRHHPLFVRYRQEQLEKQRQGPHSQTPCASDIVKAQGCVLDVMEEHYGTSSLVESRSAIQQRIVVPLEDATICTAHLFPTTTKQEWYKLLSAPLSVTPFQILSIMLWWDYRLLW